MNEIKKLAGQTVIYGISSIGGRILGFLLVPLYVRLFNPAEFSVYVELFAYMTFLNIIYTYGMETAFFRYASRTDDLKKVFSTAFYSILSTTLLFTFLFLIFLPNIARGLGYQGHERYILWLVFILALDTLAVIPFASLRQQERPVKFAVIKIINILVNIGLNIFFLILCPYLLAQTESSLLVHVIKGIYNPEIGIEYIFISNLLSSALTLLLLSYEFRWLAFKWDKGLWRQMIKYAMPLLVVGLAGMFNDSFDRIILKHLLPFDAIKNKELLGIYGANVKLAAIMMLSIQAFKYAAEPFFFGQAKKVNPEKIYARVMKYFIITGLLVFLVVSVYINLFGFVFYGRKGMAYSGGLNVVPILLMAGLMLGVYYNLSIWYKLQDKTYFGALISLLGAVVTLLFNVLLIPAWGYMASAWGKLSCYALMVVVSYGLSRKFYPVQYPVKRIFLYFLTAVALIFLKYQFFNNNMNPFSEFFIGTLILLIFAVLVFVLEKEELKKLFH